MSSSYLVVIPTYNERPNIEAMLKVIMGLQPGFEVLVVDDGSPDGTAIIVSTLATAYPGRIHLLQRQSKQGLGTAYVQGFGWALQHGYSYIFEMDADFSHNPADLPRLLAACEEEGNDLAIGSRYVSGVNVVNWPMSRVLLSYLASKYVRFITGMPIKDATAGFKCYHRTVLETVLRQPPRFVGYAFQTEMKFKAWKYGFRIKEVSIIFTERAAGQSKMSPGIVREAVWGVLSLKVRSWFRRWQRQDAMAIKSVGVPAVSSVTQ